MGINIIGMTPLPPRPLPIRLIVGPRQVQSIQPIEKKKGRSKDDQNQSFRQCFEDELDRQGSKNSNLRIDQFQ